MSKIHDYMRRDLQRTVLEQLRETYPEPVYFDEITGIEPSHIPGVVKYLEGHGLIKVRWRRNTNVPEVPFDGEITSAGLDFLADNGGLTAILGVVTVKFHDETLRQLLSDRVDSLPAATAEEKTVLKSALRNLPSKALEEALKQLVGLGARHLPEAVPLLHTWITQLSR